MLGKLKGFKRLFSNEKLYERLKELEPVINSKIPHKDFTSFLYYSSLPVFVGGLSAVSFNFISAFSDLTPSIVLSTLIYSSLHTTLLAGAHFGFGSAIYNDNSDVIESRYLKLQLYYPFLAPILTTFLSCTYWVFPYTHLKSLYTISGIGFVYLGTFIADSFFADRAKVLPLWYKDLKRKSTILSISGILLLLLAVFKYPEETKLKNLRFPINLNN